MSIKDIARHFREAAQYDWKHQARPEQLAPAGDWSVWLYLAGRGAGKTRAASEWVRSMMCGSSPLAPGRYRHMALIGHTAADCRDVLLGEGRADGSGLLQVCPPDFRPTFESSKRRVTFRNGSICTLYSSEEPDALRGPEHDGAWLDEACKYSNLQDVWDVMQFGLRRGSHPQVVVTTTPRPSKWLKRLMDDPTTRITRGATIDNAANLPKKFIDSIMSRYSGTRLGRQEILGEVLEDTPGALWKLSDIDAARVSQAPPLQRVVVAVDPAVSSGENADETGIVVVGRAADGHCYVIADYSLKASPDAWAREVVRAYHRHQADRVVAEVNNGGALVEATLRTVDPNVSYLAVHASRGKIARAEPVAAMAEQGRLHHVGSFPQLEDQLCALTSDYNRARDGSPDRADALIWAITEVGLDPEPGIIAWAREEAAKVGIPKPKPDDPAAHTATLQAPEGFSTVYLLSGRCVAIPEDRLVRVSPEDAEPLLGIGWKRIEPGVLASS